MSDIRTLLDRLKAYQRELILEAARHDMLPSDRAIQRIAQLENAIAGVEAVMHELEDNGRSS